MAAPTAGTLAGTSAVSNFHNAGIPFSSVPFMQSRRPGAALSNTNMAAQEGIGEVKREKGRAMQRCCVLISKRGVLKRAPGVRAMQYIPLPWKGIGRTVTACLQQLMLQCCCRTLCHMCYCCLPSMVARIHLAMPCSCELWSSLFSRTWWYHAPFWDYLDACLQKHETYLYSMHAVLM
jgi:hypothetical protein